MTILLLAANAYVRRPLNPRTDPTATDVDNSTRAPLPQAQASTQTSAPALMPAPPLPHTLETYSRGASAARPGFDWSIVESADYKQYAANLRAIGFPEEWVRAIVIFDVNAKFAAHEAPLRSKEAPPDAPLRERQRMPTPDDLDRLRQLRELEIEKQAALKDILGIYVPRDVLKSPTSRNYEAYEYALDALPLEKRAAAQTVVENEWFGDDTTTGLSRAVYVESNRRRREERDVALNQILTPEEFQQFEMNTMPAATELARRTIGMEPTEAEFGAMFKIAWQNWVDTGGVYGVWRAVPVPPGQIAAADQRMDADLRTTLGPDRYLDYQMATSDVGQQLRNLAARYDLPREILAQAFPLQTEAAQLEKLLARGRAGNNVPAMTSADPAQLQSRLATVQQQTEQVLGATLWQAWNDGKNRRVKLDP
jgi:hypothetical protein